jgi:glycosyltransferase involved in cell wall biosynthesis
MPVFNDWESAALLTRDLAAAFAGSGLALDLVMVDDCSIDAVPTALPADPSIRRIDCLKLATNVGHQRAIATGLMALCDRADLDMVAVMDSDGEDRPAELRALVEKASADPGAAYVAQRSKRSEGWLFRAFYWLYVRIFRLLTGHGINFGNFSVLQAAQVRRVANSAHVWNNFPAAVIQARIPVRYVPTVRGTRYAGQSRMNFVSLVAHGLGAISVFSEAVFIRILVASALLLLLSLSLAGLSLFMKLVIQVAFPNWATTVLGFALVISVQALMMPILMAFLLLNNRSLVQPLPRKIVLDLIDERRTLWCAPDCSHKA